MRSSRGLEMLSYLPWYYKNSRIMRAILDGQGMELDEVRNALEESLLQFYADTTTWNTEKWEKELAITPPTNATLELRHALIRAKLLRPDVMTPAQIEAIANCFIPSKAAQVITVPGTYSFKVRLPFDDLTWYQELKQALNEAKPAHLAMIMQYFSEAIEDISGDIGEEAVMYLHEVAYEAYPWTGRMADGSCSFTQGATFNNSYFFNNVLRADACLDGDDDVVQFATIHDGAIVADGKRKFSTNATRKVLFNSQENEQLSNFSIHETGYSEEGLTSHVSSGTFAADGIYHFGYDAGPLDNGGDLVVTVGRKFDGSAICNAGSSRFFDGIYSCDGSANFYLDNKRAPLFNGLISCDGSKRFMQGGEYFATYRYSDQL